METIRILHLEDDEEDYIIIRDLLEDPDRQAYEIDWISSFEDAKERISSKEYDICLVDYLLGQYTGLEVLKYIKEENPHLPVIIFTGRGDDDIDIEAMTAGAADYLLKGQIDSNILERSIRYSISQSRTLKQLIENEKSLRAAEQFALTGRVAQLIAHEVRNPLTNVKLALQQLQEEIPDSKGSYSGLFELINRNCNRINQLITDLFDSTRFNKLNYEAVSINDILDETVELAKDRVELKKVKIEKLYEVGICKVYIDKEQMKIALLNILINAIEEVPEGKGVIKLMTNSPNKKCVVIISDNGKGIDPNLINRIFEPFFTGKKKGLGLGLTTTYNIMLSHKGTMKVESKLGKGTSFIITLDFASRQ
jgi:signal transduction histidine kinase